MRFVVRVENTKAEVVVGSAEEKFEFVAVMVENNFVAVEKVENRLL